MPLANYYYYYYKGTESLNSRVRVCWVQFSTNRIFIEGVPNEDVTYIYLLRCFWAVSPVEEVNTEMIPALVIFTCGFYDGVVGYGSLPPVKFCACMVHYSPQLCRYLVQYIFQVWEEIEAGERLHITNRLECRCRCCCWLANEIPLPWLWVLTQGWWVTTRRNLFERAHPEMLGTRYIDEMGSGRH